MRSTWIWPAAGTRSRTAQRVYQAAKALELQGDLYTNKEECQQKKNEQIEDKKAGDYRGRVSGIRRERGREEEDDTWRETFKTIEEDQDAEQGDGIGLMCIAPANMDAARVNATKKAMSADMPTVKQALESQDADEWIESIVAEIKNLVDHNTGTEVPREKVPAGAQVIPSKVVLRRMRSL